MELLSGPSRYQAGHARSPCSHDRDRPGVRPTCEKRLFSKNGDRSDLLLLTLYEESQARRFDGSRVVSVAKRAGGPFRRAMFASLGGVNPLAANDDSRTLGCCLNRLVFARDEPDVVSHSVVVAGALSCGLRRSRARVVE
jgi:hypothetical protein